MVEWVRTAVHNSPLSGPTAYAGSMNKMLRDLLTGRARTRVIELMTVMAALSGCMSPEELRTEYEATCRSYGFQPGTAEIADCIERESAARRYVPSDQWPPTWYGPGYLPPPGRK
jgi:hypothetical protein